MVRHDILVWLVLEISRPSSIFPIDEAALRGLCAPWKMYVTLQTTRTDRTNIEVIHDSKHVRRVGNVTLNHMISVCRAQTQFREGIAGANKNKADCHPSPMW